MNAWVTEQMMICCFNSRSWKLWATAFYNTGKNKIYMGGKSTPNRSFGRAKTWGATSRDISRVETGMVCRVKFPWQQQKGRELLYVCVCMSMYEQVQKHVTHCIGQSVIKISDWNSHKRASKRNKDEKICIKIFKIWLCCASFLYVYKKVKSGGSQAVAQA